MTCLSGGGLEGESQWQEEDTWETEEESGPRSGLQLQVGADLGRLAHLLLKLSADTIVLLDAQRKRLCRFLRLQLRLARKKTEEEI